MSASQGYPSDRPLPAHGRYGPSPIVDRPVHDWPNGARLAVYIAVNVEAFAFGEGMAPDLNPKQPEPDVVNYSWRDWGNRVGVWRLIELLDEFSLPATVLFNTAVYDEQPAIAPAFRRRGDEFVAHGHTNSERQADMDSARESAMIAAVTARMTAEEGCAPTGWMGPWVSESAATPELLRLAGYEYVMDWMMDDQPTALRTDHGPLMSLPYARPTNDITLLHGAKWTPTQWVDALIDQFDEMLLQSRRQQVVFNLSLHPYLMHAFRLKHLRRFFEHLNACREQVWVTHAGEIVRHARRCAEGMPAAPQP